jgi:hypothetical protein
MFYALILLTGLSSPELLWTHSSLDLCLQQAKQYPEAGAICIELGLLQHFNGDA